MRSLALLKKSAILTFLTGLLDSQAVRKAVTAGFFSNACRLEVSFILSFMQTYVSRELALFWGKT